MSRFAGCPIWNAFGAKWIAFGAAATLGGACLAQSSPSSGLSQTVQRPAAATQSASTQAAETGARAVLDPAALVTKIAFGSCANQGKPQPIWEPIAAEKPDLFLFLGDNIYADTADMTVMRDKYAQLAAIPEFARFRAACPILATWDDHDYGKNDAGAEFLNKREAQREFLDFFGAAVDSPRRAREGVYDAAVIGPEGRRVQVILLDTRYHRSALKRQSDDRAYGDGRPGKYLADTDSGAAVLGEAQWKWLEEQLRQPAELRIVASSIQLVAAEHGYESWGNFPAERARFGDLLRATGAAGVIVLSGDRHAAELSIAEPLPPGTCKVGELNPPYPLIDVTSSALNQPRGWQNEINRHRVGNTYFEPNYGVLTIDWNASPRRIEIRICDGKGRTAIRHGVRLEELAAGTENSPGGR